MKVEALRRIIPIATIVFAVAAAFAPVHGLAEDAPAAQIPPPSADDLRRADWIADGRTRFVSACGYCHGQEGEAGKVRSFKERKNWDPQKIHDTIMNGRIRGANVMPPWGGSIPDDEIWKIVAYIKSLSLDFPGPITSQSNAK
jgi:mono/diheme cytochrome c family protein